MLENCPDEIKRIDVFEGQPLYLLLHYVGKFSMKVQVRSIFIEIDSNDRWVINLIPRGEAIRPG